MENRWNMQVLINGEKRELPDGLTLSAVVRRLSLPERRMAVEVNKQVIRKQDWESFKIATNDNIEIVHFVGGG
jgi:sulfur carrier protein